MLGFCGALLTARSAAAADFTWSGTASIGEPNWSNATNWGGTAPSGTVGKLEFPTLKSAACASPLPETTCYQSHNDITGLVANSMSIGETNGYVGYNIEGAPLTIGSGGIKATTGSSGNVRATLFTPITLGAPQTLAIGEFGRLSLAGNVTGTSEALSISLPGEAVLELASHVEAGPVSVTGSGTLYIQGGGDSPPSLNSGGNPVELHQAKLLSPGRADTGPLTSTAGEIRLDVGEYNSELAVHGGVTLDSASAVAVTFERFDREGRSSKALLTATGPVNLANSKLSLSLESPYCPEGLQPGDVYTLITTEGPLAGTFAGISNGTTVHVANCPETFRIGYTAHSVIATVRQGSPVGGALTFGELAAGGYNPSEFCVECFMGKVISFALPVDGPTGNFWHSFDDVNVPGRGMALDLKRTYNSRAAETKTGGPFGFGWSFSYDMSLGFPDSTHVLVNQENGSQITFTQSGSTYTAPPRVTATLLHNGDGSWTFVRRHRDTFSFASSGRLTQEKDLNGYVTALAYNGGGQLETVTDPAGRKLTFAFTGSHIVSVTDPLGRVVKYLYDEAGNLTDVTDVNGGNTHFTYDAEHRIRTMRMPNQAPGVPGSTGAVVTNRYDSQGRVIEQADQLERTTKFAYSGEPLGEAGGSTTITDPKGNVTVQNYEFGELISETKGYGAPQAATWTFSYDPATLGMTTVTDPDGHTTTSTFDAEGNTLTIEHALGRRTTNTYDSLNDPLTTTDALNVATTMTYDTHGNLLTRSRAVTGTSEVQKTTYTYGDSTHPGDVTVMRDPEGKTWKYTYDADGDRTSTTDPLGEKTTSTYNAIGWLLTTVSPRGNVEGGNPASFTTTYSYENPATHALDGFGDVRTVTDPLGHVTTYGYDPGRNRTSLTDPAGHTTTYTYDAADEQTAVHRADGTTLQTTYWPDGAVKDQIDGAGHVTHYDYDPLGRVSATTDPLGRVTQYDYDGAGNRTSVTDPQGRVTTTSYDAANEPTAISYSDGTTPKVSNVTYDADGQRTGMTDGAGTWLWTWDSLHRLTSVTEGGNGTVKYQYDLRDNPTTITYPGGHAVTRGYDDSGRWTSVGDWLGHTTTFSYDADGNMTSQALPSETGVRDTSTYANDGTLSSISDKRGASTLLEANYTRDANRQLSADSSLPTSTGSYGYTALNQLCYAGSSGTAPCSSPPSGAASYQYDSADNLVRMSATTQTFDSANQLTSATAPTGSSEQAPGAGASGGGGIIGGTGSGGSNGTLGSLGRRVIPTVTSGKVTFAHASRQRRSVMAQVVSTREAGDLVLAFLSAKGPSRGGQGVSKIKGGGLRWSLVTNASARGGYVAIWQARAPKRMARVRVSVTLRNGGFAGALAVVGFDSRAAVARGAKGSSSKGAPRVAVAVPSDAVVWAVGQDAAQHAKPKPLPGQLLVAKTAVRGGSTSWIQSEDSQATKRLLVGDSAPKSSSWAIDVVAIQEQAGGTATMAPPTTNPLLSGPTTPEVPSTIKGTLTYTYDAEGDRTGVTGSDGISHTFAYNQASELTGVGSGVSYTYNGDGLRMTKTTGGTTTPFVWDVTTAAPSLIGDGTGEYVYGPGGVPLEQVSGTTVLWLHHDQLGSTRLLTDSTGKTVATYEYSPYGSLSTATGTASTPMLFAGQYHDGESGLYYLRARYYDSATAQFLTRDPAVATTRSPYSYGGDNPPNLTDPTGKWCWPPWDASQCENPATQAVKAVQSGDVCISGTSGCTSPGESLINNIGIAESTPFFGPALRLDPFIGPLFDLAKTKAGESVSPLTWLNDLAGLATLGGSGLAGSQAEAWSNRAFMESRIELWGRGAQSWNASQDFKMLDGWFNFVGNVQNFQTFTDMLGGQGCS